MINKYWQMIKNTARETEIRLYEPIGKDFWTGEGLGAKQFAEDLKALGSELVHIILRINSPGGNVFEGTAIYNQLQAHKARITVYVDGIAASIASVIAMAGDKIIMPENSLMMVHDPSGVVAGGAGDMRKFADVLDKVKECLIVAYRQKTGLTVAAISALLSEETWMTAAEAVDKGFADELAAPVQIAASFDLSNFRKVPASLLKMTGQANDLNPHGRNTTRQSDDQNDYSKLRGMDLEDVTRLGEKVWTENPSVRAEFTNKETFVAYLKAEAMGKVRILYRGPRE